ncbi:MAG: flagellar protein, partial [Rhodobacteraceae bacterium]|nr:flagellar protein [Paracoccaceae bacterium]
MILYQPIIPTDGIAGWKFLQSTYDKQFDTFSKDPVLSRESDYFLENIGKVKTASDLVKDTRLLGIALGAFGLDDQLPMKALVQRVLEDGSSADDALA